MSKQNPSPLALIAAFITLSAVLPGQSLIERSRYVGQYFGVNGINVMGSAYDIRRDASLLRVFLYAYGATPNLGYRGTTRSYANGRIHAGLFGRRRELVGTFSDARSWPEHSSQVPGIVFRSATSAALRVLGSTRSTTSWVAQRPLSPISYFQQSWSFMAGPVPVTIRGNVRGDYYLYARASMARGGQTSVRAHNRVQAWASASGQVGISGARIGLESDIQLAAPAQASIDQSSYPSPVDLGSLRAFFLRGDLAGTLRVRMDPIRMRLIATVDAFLSRWRYTLLNYRLYSTINRSWSL